MSRFPEPRRECTRILSWLLLFSAVPLLLAAQPFSNTPLGNFNALWEDFERNYPLFDEKKIDWAAARARHGAGLGSATEGPELWRALSGLVLELRDPHVAIQAAGFGEVRSGTGGSPSAYNATLIREQYLVTSARLGKVLTWGRTESGNLYLHIDNLLGTVADNAWLRDFEALLREQSPKGILLDLRHCPGGNHRVARDVAESLAHSRRRYLSIQEKKGADHDAFKRARKWYLSPRGIIPQSTSIAVLTDASTVSAAEVLVLALRTQSNVTVIGEKTAGAFGDVQQRQLPNGWTYTLPVNRFLDGEGKVLSSGLIPDKIDRGEDPAHDELFEFAERVCGGK